MKTYSKPEHLNMDKSWINRIAIGKVKFDGFYSKYEASRDCGLCDCIENAFIEGQIKAYKDCLNCEGFGIMPIPLRELR